MAACISRNRNCIQVSLVDFRIIFFLAPTAAPGDLLTVVINANCTKYIMNEATKLTFIDDFKTDVAAQINIDKSRITVWNVGCGSIIVNLTISAPPGGSSAPTKAAAMTSLQNLLSSGLMRVTLSGAVIPAIVPGGTVKTLPPPTTVPTTLPFIPVVKTNWMPMMISFALMLTLIISIALFCAWLHGRYYRKKQYTDINCNKPKPVKAEDAIENMNKKQRRLKLDTIMDGGFRIYVYLFCLSNLIYFNLFLNVSPLLITTSNSQLTQI